MNRRQDVSLTYRRFAERECQGYSDAYYRLALAVSEDDEMMEFIAAMPVIQPNLFLASVQFLTGPEAMPRTGLELRAFLARRGDEVGEVMRSHRTQTNEVGRCAALLPALPPGPLALVEVGASAGLCLLLDRFRYRYDGHTDSRPPGGSIALGAAASPVQLACAVAGPVPVPTALPVVAWRQGLDLHPIDVRDEDAVRWLLACVWPDHPARRRRVEGAIALARQAPALVRAGDLVDDLPALLAEVPSGAQLVVFHSAVLSYVPEERRRALADTLASASRERDIVWVSNEAAGVVPEITALAPALGGDLRFLLGRTRFAAGRRRDELLALSHPHGARLTWL